MNDIVHARLTGLLEAAMFYRFEREPRDHQLGLQIGACGAKAGDDLRDLFMCVRAGVDFGLKATRQKPTNFLALGVVGQFVRACGHRFLRAGRLFR
jgi:hypothetical protein